MDITFYKRNLQLNTIFNPLQLNPEIDPQLFASALIALMRNTEQVPEYIESKATITDEMEMALEQLGVLSKPFSYKLPEKQSLESIAKSQAQGTIDSVVDSESSKMLLQSFSTYLSELMKGAKSSPTKVCYSSNFLIH